MHGGKVGGIHFSEKECYVKALEADEKFAWSWYNLASCCDGGKVGGVAYSKIQCLVRSM